MKIEIGKNLCAAIYQVVGNANKGGVSAGNEVQKAFGLNLTEMAVHLGAHKQAIDKGMTITINRKGGGV